MFRNKMPPGKNKEPLVDKDQAARRIQSVKTRSGVSSHNHLYSGGAYQPQPVPMTTAHPVISTNTTSVSTDQLFLALHTELKSLSEHVKQMADELKALKEELPQARCAECGDRALPNHYLCGNCDT